MSKSATTETQTSHLFQRSSYFKSNIKSSSVRAEDRLHFAKYYGLLSRIKQREELFSQVFKSLERIALRLKLSKSSMEVTFISESILRQKYGVKPFAPIILEESVLRRETLQRIEDYFKVEEFSIRYFIREEIKRVLRGFGRLRFLLKEILKVISANEDFPGEMKIKDGAWFYKNKDYILHSIEQTNQLATVYFGRKKSNNRSLSDLIGIPLWNNPFFLPFEITNRQSFSLI